MVSQFQIFTMTTFLDVPFHYAVTAIPKRARKERDIFLTTAVSLPIPELTAADAPIVIEAEVEYDYVVKTGEGSRDTAWKHTLVPVSYRRYGNKLLRPFDTVFQCGFKIPETFTVGRNAAPELFRTIRETMDGFYKFEILPTIDSWRLDTFDETDFQGKISASDRDERAAKMSAWVADYGLVFIDDMLWKSTELPVWDIGYESLRLDLGPTAAKGKRRFLRPIPYYNMARSKIGEVFWDKTLADTNFTEQMTEEKAYAQASRDAMEIAPERGHITVVGELPFGRNDRLQLIYECLAYLITGNWELPDAFLARVQTMLKAVDRIRRDEAADIEHTVNEMTNLGRDFAALSLNRPHDRIAYCLKKVARTGKTDRTVAVVDPFSHRAKKANGYDTLPAQGVIPVLHDGKQVLISREDARKVLESKTADVKTWAEVFKVDGLPAFRATGSTTLSIPLNPASKRRSLDEQLGNSELDRLAKCDWETWRRGAGMVLRPEGTGRMAARMFYHRDYLSTLYIFPGEGRATYEAKQELSSVGEGKRLCEQALAAFGYGEGFFDEVFGEIFHIKEDHARPNTSYTEQDTDDEDVLECGGDD
jgi:hypothetical protein